METTDNLNSQEKHPISMVGRAQRRSIAAPQRSRGTAQTRAHGEHVLLRWKVRKKSTKKKKVNSVEVPRCVDIEQ